MRYRAVRQLLLLFAFVLALAGCSAGVNSSLDPDSALTQAARAVERAREAGAPAADAGNYRAAQRKLDAARRLLGQSPEQSRRLAESAAADARLAEAVAKEQALRRAQKKMEAAVARLRKRLVSNGM
jgi:hypothetical protein